jgi:nitroreductase
MPPENALHDPLALITSRRSIAPKRLYPPGPTIADIKAMVGAALTAPDHGGLRPWRIIQVADEGRERLAEVFVAAKVRRFPDTPAALLDRERDKALNAPALLVVCARPRTDLPEIPPYEQLIAVGATVQNLLLAAHALGYGASLLSGEKARDPIVRSCLGLHADEILVGFLSIGSIAKPAPARPQPDIAAFMTVWGEPSLRLADVPLDESIVVGP